MKRLYLIIAALHRHGPDRVRLRDDRRRELGHAHRRREGAGKLQPRRRRQLAGGRRRHRGRQGQGRPPGHQEVLHQLPDPGRVLRWTRCTNSGIFIRCAGSQQDHRRTTAYEVNILRPASRPGIRHGRPREFRQDTGAESAQLQGRRQVEYVRDHRQGHAPAASCSTASRPSPCYDSQFASGPFTLQFGNRGKEPGGVIKWRKVEIRPLQ